MEQQSIRAIYAKTRKTGRPPKGSLRERLATMTVSIPVSLKERVAQETASKAAVVRAALELYFHVRDRLAENPGLRT